MATSSNGPFPPELQDGHVERLAESAATLKSLRASTTSPSPSPSSSSATSSSTMERPDDTGLWRRGNEYESPTALRNVSGHSGESKEAEIPPESGEGLQRLALKERIRHFTWTWFTMTMATGGIANVLHTVPYRFHGLYAIGCVFFIFNIVLFLFNICMISLRFYLYPSTFRASFLHPTESLFIPASLVSFGILLLNISQYGVHNTGHWLEDVMVVLFWIYCALAIIFSCGIYLVMWSTQYFSISQMTPVWIFPAYPLLITGPHASTLAAKTAANRSLDIIIGGVVLQGIGFMVSLMIYSAFLYRLMTQKLPPERLRPGMFISVGPSGFTISGLVGMGQALPNCVPETFMGDGKLAAQISVVLANWTGLWLWGLAIWFFIVSVAAHWSAMTRGRMHFAMTWYSFVFPNTALTTATFALGRALDCAAIRVLGCALTCGLIATWLFVFASMLRAVAAKQVLWPQKQEDRDEGGWRVTAAEEQWRERRRSKSRGRPERLDDEPEHRAVVPTPPFGASRHDLTASNGMA